MGFNRNDLEGDDDFNFDDDNNFDFGDEGDDSSFDFGDEPADIGLDNDDAGFGFEEEDMPEIDEEEEAGGGGVSRTFIIIAGIMILLFLLGLGAVLLLGSNPQKSEFEMTSDAIVALNLTTAADALLTETAKAVAAGTQTAVALTTQVDITGVEEGETVDADRNIVVVVTGQAPVARVVFKIDGQEISSATEPPYSSALDVLALGPGQHTLEINVIDGNGQTTTAETTFTISESAALTATARVPTITPTPSPDETQAAANALLTQTADAATQTANFLLTPQATNTVGFTENDVALTATALAILLAPGNQPTTIAGAPTQELLTPGAPLPTQLPQTGFFDDLAAGNANVGMIALLALGLVGVIVVSRRVRTANK